MQKFLNSSGRMVIFDEQEHTINAVSYTNDRIVKSDIICNEVTEWVIETLIRSWSLTKYEPVYQRASVMA